MPLEHAIQKMRTPQGVEVVVTVVMVVAAATVVPQYDGYHEYHDIG